MIVLSNGNVINLFNIILFSRDGQLDTLEIVNSIKYQNQLVCFI